MQHEIHEDTERDVHTCDKVHVYEETDETVPTYTSVGRDRVCNPVDPCNATGRTHTKRTRKEILPHQQINGSSKAQNNTQTFVRRKSKEKESMPRKQTPADRYYDVGRRWRTRAKEARERRTETFKHGNKQCREFCRDRR